MAKKYIKEEILNTARRLFSEHGYAGVSMRDVADALGISVGNLTYHYPRKEALIEAVVLDIHRWQTPFSPPTTLEELNALFARIHNVILENAFYFWHYTQLAQLSPAVHDIQKTSVMRQYTLLTEGFKNLTLAGLMQKETYGGQHRQLAQAVLILCIYWTPQSRLEATLDTPKDFLDCVWSVLVPALTEAGARIYRDTIQRIRLLYESMDHG